MKGWEHVTEADIRQPVPSKYRNVRTRTPDGLTFDSRREAEYWLGLKAREKAGDISDLRRQVPFALLAPGNVIVAHYIADFVYRHGGKAHVVDVKGVKTQMYRLKKKWLDLQEGVVIEEV